ncbi:MAG: hypothetical protein AAB225_07380 [Acidobacteriota bacterium]
MRSRALILLAAPLLLLGADEKKKAARPAARPAKPAAAATAKAETARLEAIPPEAKQIETDTYRYTDPEGKTWILNKTPFGIMKSEEKLSKTEDDLPPGMTVVEDGEILKFERPTIFGPVRWTRKKTELTEMERKAWERELRNRAKE